MRDSNTIVKKERKPQIGLLVLLTLIFLWAVLRATAFDSLHSAVYTSADTAIPTTSEKMPIDDLSVVITAEDDYLDSVGLCVTGIPEDLGGSIACTISHNGNRIYSGSQKLQDIPSDQWLSIQLGLAVEKNQQYQIHLTTIDATASPSLYVRPESGVPVMAL